MQSVTTGNIVFREATTADLPSIMHVRVSVVENTLTEKQLEERGVTNGSIAASFLTDSKGWVAMQDGEIVAFAIADRASQSIFALFVLPAFERRGIGGRLLDLALRWLWDNGAERVHLGTGAQTKAAGFYERRGFVRTGIEPRGDIHYEYSRPDRGTTRVATAATQNAGGGIMT